MSFHVCCWEFINYSLDPVTVCLTQTQSAFPGPTTFCMAPDWPVFPPEDTLLLSLGYALGEAPSP